MGRRKPAAAIAASQNVVVLLNGGKAGIDTKLRLKM
jgi:hypothetical protein